MKRDVFLLKRDVFLLKREVVLLKKYYPKKNIDDNKSPPYFCKKKVVCGEN
jgi:hypothetical protein